LYVPGFLTKRDLIPGTDNHFQVHTTRTGRFRGYCAEFCGLDHARMLFDVRIVSPADYSRWLAQRPTSSSGAGSGPGPGSGSRAP
jgi:cytochrome c oxidase subunit 2